MIVELAQLPELCAKSIKIVEKAAAFIASQRGKVAAAAIEENAFTPGKAVDRF